MHSTEINALNESGIHTKGSNGQCTVETVETILRRTSNYCTTLWSYECNGSPISQLVPREPNISLGICDLLIDPGTNYHDQ